LIQPSGNDMSLESCARGKHQALVVDDDESVRDAISRLLVREGFHVTTAESTEQALAHLETLLPCLACIDVSLPGANGLSLCRTMKNRPQLANTPVILISGRVEAEDVEAGETAGANDYVKKPFDPHELRFRLRAQRRLHESRVAEARVRERLSTLSRATHDALVLLDIDGRITHFTEGAVDMFGYPEHEVVGRDICELLVPNHYRPALNAVLTYFQTTGTDTSIGQHAELVARKQCGEEFPVELYLTRTAVGGDSFALGVFHDITERRHHEQQLLARQAQLTAILSSVPFGLAIIGFDKRIRWANPAALTMFDAGTLEEVCGQICCRTMCDAPDCVCPVLDGKQTVRLEEKTVTRRKGPPLAVLKSIHEVEFGDERVLLETFMDLTVRKQTETELGHSRKLEAVGQLAAGIAHEINTPTQYASDNTAFLARAFAKLTKLLEAYQSLVSDLEIGPLATERSAAERSLLKKAKLPYLLEEIPQALTEAQEGLTRIGTIVRAMKEFSHPSTGIPAYVDLREVISTTVTVSRNEWKYVADVVTQFDPALGPVPCLRDELSQVLLNLIVNASHAIEDANRAEPSRKGTITITTKEAGPNAELTLTDTGCGIPESARARVFDPFFTTKPVGKGTGQGLAISHSVIVDKHHGSIRFETEVGRGTTFVISLPMQLPNSGS
jgi:two-component system, NtrC family, sensor kinase